MNKKHLLLALLSLSLMGCEDTPAKSTPTPSTDSDVIDNNQTTTPDDTNADSDANDKKDDTTDDKKDDTDGDKKDDTTDDKKDDTSGGDGDSDKTPTQDPDVNNTEWADDVWDAMRQYLGGYVLPYIDLGKYVETAYVVTSSAKAYLKITSETEVNQALIASTKTSYEAAGWTSASTGETTYSATLKSSALSVDITTDTDKTIILKAYYDEPYSDNPKITDWTQDITSAFDTYMDQHVSPFVYLGTENPTCTYSSKKLTILGGKWDERIFTAAKAAFDDTWEVTEKSDNYGSIFNATKIFTDACQLSIVIDGYNNANFSRACYTVTWSEGYYPAGYTEWVDDFSSYESDLHMHNDDIPAVYLGTKNPTISSTYWKTQKKLTVTGASYSEQIITDAKALFAKDTTWRVEDHTMSAKPAIVAYKKFDDGCRFFLEIGANGSGSSAKAKCTIHYEDNTYTGITTATSWPSSVQTKMTEILGNNEVPYVYLNKDTPTITGSGTTVTITGEKGFYSTIVEKAEATYKAAGWTVTTTPTVDGMNFSAVKTFADTGDKLTATIAATPYPSTKVSLKVSIEEGYHEPTTDSEKAWPSTIQTYMTKYFNNYVLPYVYLGARNPTGKYSSSKLTITGVAWNDAIYTNFKSALEAESEDTTSPVTWEIEEDTSTSTKKIIAVGLNSSDSNSYTVTLYKSTANVPTLEMTMSEAFKVPTADKDKAWPAAIQTTMTSYYNQVLPYIYLGTSNPTATYTASGYRLDVKGGLWNDSVITYAKQFLEEEGYTTKIGKGYSGGLALQAYKEQDDGTNVTYYVYKSANTATATSNCYIYFGNTLTNTGTDWTDSEKKTMSDNLGGYTLPYIQLGGMTSTVTENKTSEGDGTVKIALSSSTDVATRTVLFNAMKTLKAADSNWQFDYMVRNSGSTWYHNGRIEGTLTQSDGSQIVLLMNATSNKAITIYLTYQKAYTTTETGWSSDVTKTMSSFLFGTVVPYVYLGRDNPAVSTLPTQNYMTVTGGIWNDSIKASAKTAFENDEDHDWDIGTDYSTSGMYAFVATTTDSYGFRITVKISYVYSTTYGTKQAQMKIYCNQ